LAMFEGGTGALPAALIQCLTEHGGRVRTGAPVEELIVTGGRVTGVRVKGGEDDRGQAGCADRVQPGVGAAGYLLPKGVLPERLRNRVEHIPTKGRGISDYKLNLALRGRISMPGTRSGAATGWTCGCVQLLPRLPADPGRRGGTAHAGDVPEHIPGLALAPTAFEPSMAPAGCDTFWFWSGLTPADPRIGWEQARARITRR